MLIAVLLNKIQHISIHTKLFPFSSFKIRLLSISFSLCIFLIFVLSFFNNNNIDFLIINTNLLPLQYNNIEQFNSLQFVYANPDLDYFHNVYDFNKTPRSTSNNNLLSYENKNLGIKFQYLSDWYIVENKNRMELRKTETKAGGPPIAMISLGYGFVDPKSYKPIKMLLADLIPAMLAANEDDYKYKITNKQKFFVKNNPIYSQVTEYSLSEKKAMDFYFNNPDQYILHIRYESSIQSFDLHVKDIRTVINSLQILPFHDGRNSFENPLKNDRNSQSEGLTIIDGPSF